MSTIAAAVFRELKLVSFLSLVHIALLLGATKRSRSIIRMQPFLSLYLLLVDEQSATHQGV